MKLYYLFVFCFNPRVLAGGRDPVGMDIDDAYRFQSTRPRGRTRLSTMAAVPSYNVFQSTRPRGRTRRDVTLFMRGITPFQSTRPRGRTRLWTSCSWFAVAGFNPRVLAGGRDMRLMKSILPHCGFQSTRPRGRTRLFSYPMDS